ncbi:purple acid phosphatase family protein [Mucilaginibacter aquariorum]|uniref:Metallophosphoesterase family protein n=1 Tax=Mucilaginibacter aquariorum TaxID=2967225 RepID=A0ABT1SYM4_9SPHI|nr:metallophosphoesterase family protein [Mucilaginibacter aquariorum]MCQ6957320.1 metallophosphoesterase family protein [Mucilaginibacter aquariorum]
MNKIARRHFLGQTLKMSALMPVIGSPARLLLSNDNHHAAADMPDRVILTVTPDTATSITINWRTANTTEAGYAEYAVADAHPEFVANLTRVNATGRPFKFNDTAFINHRVSLNGLKPGTLYAYRVGRQNNWSEWFQFSTAKGDMAAAKLSFIYLGDAQVGIRPLWSRVIRKAYAAMPGAQLVIHAGDLVNRANEDNEWDDWFAAGGYIHASTPALMTPGNHEYTHEDGKPHLSVYWNEQFGLPDNGPSDDLLKGSCYYTDIQGVRIISLNTQMIEEASTQECINRQVAWLRQVLRQNTRQWTCVVMHHPIYSTKKGRDNKKTREFLKPVFDAYDVDLVLQGHDHAYARGMNKIALTNGPAGSRSGTVYVVSVSGSKMYETEPMEWADIIASHVQVYHTIDIDNNKLSFRAYLATGELLDAFDLVKNKGKQNKLIDKR